MKRRGVAGRSIFSHQHTSLVAPLLGDPEFDGSIDLGFPALSDPFDYATMLAEELRVHLDGPVLVHGDTATAYAAALAASDLHLPLYHLEAGIRSGTLTEPWPEETFRVAIDAMADYGACATDLNQANLRDERCDPTHFPVTGNTGIDALYAHIRPTALRHDYLLVTLHRRESFGEPLRNMVAGLCAYLADHPSRLTLWPVHPNPAVAAALSGLGLPPNLLLLPPVSPTAFVRLLAHARGVLTDSGGVQEEAAALGIPAVIARAVTDRPESLASGHARLLTDLGPDLDAILGYTHVSTPFLGFGDGHAAPRVLDHLQSL